MLGSSFRGVKLPARESHGLGQRYSFAQPVIRASLKSHKKANRGDTRAARLRNRRDAVHRNPSDCEHGNPYAGRYCAQPFEPEQVARAQTGLRGSRPDGTGDEIVGTFSHGFRFFYRVHRAADEESGRSHRAHDPGQHGVAAQMDAVRAARERHIDAVVDDHARATTTRAGQNVRADACQLACFEIPFADLQDVNAGVDRVTRLLDQAFASALPGHVPRKAATVCHEMQDQGAPRPSA